MPIDSCPSCSKVVPAHSAFCPYCGFSFRGGQPAAKKASSAVATGCGCVLLGGFLLVMLGFCSAAVPTPGAYDAPAATAGPRLEDQVEITDWNWRKDPDFGTDGTIHWSVSVKNNSAVYLDEVRVTITTLDAAGALVSSDFTFLSNIPPGETRTATSFADYYRNEETARVQIADVYPER